MTTTPGAGQSRPNTATADRITVPLAIFLWIVVLAGLAYGVISTLQKVVDLFS
jgi:hypothetical protein